MFIFLSLIKKINAQKYCSVLATLMLAAIGGLVCVQNRRAIAQPAIEEAASTQGITNPNDYRGALPLRLF